MVWTVEAAQKTEIDLKFEKILWKIEPSKFTTHLCT